MAERKPRGTAFGDPVTRAEVERRARHIDEPLRTRSDSSNGIDSRSSEVTTARRLAHGGQVRGWWLFAVGAAAVLLRRHAIAVALVTSPLLSRLARCVDWTHLPESQPSATPLAWVCRRVRAI